MTQKKMRKKIKRLERRLVISQNETEVWKGRFYVLLESQPDQRWIDKNGIVYENIGMMIRIHDSQQKSGKMPERPEAPPPQPTVKMWRG